jgi:hypothetical protein
MQLGDQAAQLQITLTVVIKTPSLELFDALLFIFLIRNE